MNPLEQRSVQICAYPNASSTTSLQNADVREAIKEVHNHVFAIAAGISAGVVMLLSCLAVGISVLRRKHAPADTDMCEDDDKELLKGAEL